MSVAGDNRIIAFASVISAVRSDTADLLIWANLPQKIWQNWRIANVAACHLDRPYFQRFLVDTDVYFAPQAALGATMLACVPLAFTFSLYAGAINKKVKWAP